MLACDAASAQMKCQARGAIGSANAFGDGSISCYLFTAQRNGWYKYDIAGMFTAGQAGTLNQEFYTWGIGT
jgi:hypothetical protein